MGLSVDDIKKVETALTHISGAIKGRGLYPSGHPAVLAPISKAHQLFQAVLKAKDPVLLGVVDETLVLEGKAFYDAPQPVTEVTTRLLERHIGGLVIRRGVTLNELLALLDVLTQEPKAVEAGGGAERLLTGKQVENIETRSVVEETEDLERQAQEVYSGALAIVANVFHDVRLGRIPKSSEARKVVVQMSDLILKDKDVLLGLTLLKNYDDYTYNHSVNVSILSLALGEHLGLDGDLLIQAGIAGLLHDIGKTSLCLDLIRKPGKLTPEEFEEIKRHPTAGAKILKRMQGVHPEAVLGVLQHHLRYNRKGYPTLPEHVRVSPLAYVVAIADTYDALTTVRSYQPQHQPRDALDLMHELSGTDLHPEYLGLFVEMLGVFPVGTLVRLDTNEIALVTKSNPRVPTAPRVKLVFDPDGNRIDPPREIELDVIDPKTGRADRAIVGSVDPALKGVDVVAILGPLVVTP